MISQLSLGKLIAAFTKEIHIIEVIESLTISQSLLLYFPQRIKYHTNLYFTFN